MCVFLLTLVAIIWSYAKNPTKRITLMIESTKRSRRMDRSRNSSRDDYDQMALRGRRCVCGCMEDRYASTLLQDRKPSRHILRSDPEL